MHKDLEKIAKATAAINTEAPARKIVYETGLRDALEAQRKAQEAKEAAKTERELDDALDAATRAREKEKFFRGKLEEITFTPRMNEAEYNSLVSLAADVVKKSADAYRETAEKALEAIRAARKALEQTAVDADNILENLDAAANVAQCKYRYRVLTYVGEPDRQIEDSDEWRRHVTRYSSGNACKMATSDDAEERRQAMKKLWSAADH